MEKFWQMILDMDAKIDHGFWSVVISAVFVRALLSGWVSARHGLITAGTGIFCAMTFTDSVLAWLKLPPENYETGVAAFLALTGDHIIRRALGFAKSGKISDIRKGK